jgi:hypothetical protein
LPDVEGDGVEEGDGSDLGAELDEEENEKGEGYEAGVVVDGFDADEVAGGGGEEDDGGADGLEEPETVAALSLESAPALPPHHQGSREYSQSG